MVLRKNPVHFHTLHAACAPADQSSEDALAAFDFAEHRIGERDFAIRAGRNKLDEALRFADGEIAEEQGVDQSEDGGVCTNAERE